MADPALPPGFTLDEAPPAGFTVDAPAQDQPPPAPDGSGFTDEQRQQILSYIPKARDAADLENLSLEVSNGRARIGNAQAVLDAYRQGHREFAWEQPTIRQEPDQIVTHDRSIRDTIGDALLNTLELTFPGIGTYLKQARDDGSGKAFAGHVANGAVADYGPEVGGFLDTVSSPSQYGDFRANLDRNVAHERALLSSASEGHDVASLMGELTGAALTAPLAGRAVGAVPIVARAAEAAPGLTSAAKAAAGGFAYGSGAAGPGNRLVGGITGAAVGSATDRAIPAIKAVFGSSAGKVANREFADAAERQGVDYMAADLPSAPKSKFATALSSLTFGGIPLVEQGAKNVATADAAAGRAAANVGTVADKTGAGQAAQHGAKAFMETTEGKMGQLYDAIPIPADAPAVVTGTRTMLGNLFQSFKSNPKLAAAFQNPQIKRFLDAMTPQTAKEATGILDAAGNPITRDVTHGGGLSWNDLKDFRSRVGKIIGQPGLASDGQQITELRALYAALSDDMQATATSYGPAARNAFNRANNYARARANRIENVVSLILGPNNDKAPQTAFEALQRLANEKGGDPLKLARALRSMPDDEANTVRATILDDLGDASPGQQNDKGNVFSPAQWLTNWNKLSDRAKNVLFTGEHRKTLDDLALVFSGMKSSSKFANSSKTGLFIAATHTAGVSIANPVLGMLDAALQFGGGKLLASPAFAKKLAATPMNVKGARAFWSRPWVKAMAAENPAIAGEIRAFQSAFLSANDNSGIVTSAAASPDPDEQDQNQ